MLATKMLWNSLSRFCPWIYLDYCNIRSLQ